MLIPIVLGILLSIFVKRFDYKGKNMKEDYYFIETSSGARTNIMSGFAVLNYEMFIKDVPDEKLWSKSWRYAKLGEPMKHFKEMDLLDFEIIFEGVDLDTKLVTKMFKKDISLKYGEHKKLEKIKPISKKQLVIGDIYEDFSHGRYMYLGKVSQTTKNKYDQNKNISEGYGYAWISSYENNVRIQPQYIEVLKGVKKLKKSLGKSEITLNNKYMFNDYGFTETVLHEI